MENQGPPLDVLIIGAGPAGCVSAAMLAQKGWKVHVVEKSSFPRFTIGESLLPKCMEHLEEAGLLEAVREKGYQRKAGALMVRGEERSVFNFADQYSKSWPWTWQMPRDTFDQTLVDQVMKMGVTVSFLTGLEDITFDGTTSTAVLAKENGEKEEIKARFVIDASGQAKVLARILNIVKPPEGPPRAAFFAHLVEPAASLGGDQTIIIHHEQGLWIWVIPFSNGLTSVGFTGKPEWAESLSGETPEEQFKAAIKAVPMLRKRYPDPEIALGPMRINGYSSGIERVYGDGYVLTGNSAGFLDPIFSSGVTLATYSAVHAAKCVDRELRGEEVDWETDYAKPLQSGVDVFRTYVDGWYNGDLQEVMFAPEEEVKAAGDVKRQLCSVLAGHVWDNTNPFVRKHERILPAMAKMMRFRRESVGHS